MIAERYLWVEKYRPKTIDDCVLPKATKKIFKEIVATGDIPNMLLSGTSGSGKTTVARALCDELNSDYLFINASEESGIDTLRTKIRSYASTVSINGNMKVVILDEADNLSSATQSALRSFIEEFSSSCRFILTCNFRNKLIEPIHSRLIGVDFGIQKDDRKDIAKKIAERLAFILVSEKVDCSQKILIEVVKRYFPDFRKMIGELHRFSIAGNGVIDESVIADIQQVQIDGLVTLLKERKYNSIRKWVVENMDNDMTRLFRLMYDGFHDVLKPDSIPRAVLIIHNYMSTMVADREIHLLACLIEIMADCEFK